MDDYSWLDSKSIVFLVFLGVIWELLPGEWMFPGAMWLLGICTILMLGYLACWFISNRMAPVVRTQASVVWKRSSDWDVSLPVPNAYATAAQLGMMGRNRESATKAFIKNIALMGNKDIQLAGGNEFFVTFEADGKKMEFRVPEKTYIAAEDGVQGLLVYKGEWFKAFIPNLID